MAGFSSPSKSEETSARTGNSDTALACPSPRQDGRCRSPRPSGSCSRQPLHASGSITEVPVGPGHPATAVSWPLPSGPTTQSPRGYVAHCQPRTPRGDPTVTGPNGFRRHHRDSSPWRQYHCHTRHCAPLCQQSCLVVPSRVIQGGCYRGSQPRVVSRFSVATPGSFLSVTMTVTWVSVERARPM